MEPLPRVLLKILRANPALGEHRLMTYIVIRRPYAHLELELRPFEEEGDIKVFMDKRYGERRVSEQRSSVERRATDRRRTAEELLDVVILNGR
jgi:hypothetical protein